MIQVEQKIEGYQNYGTDLLNPDLLVMQMLVVV